MADLDIQNAFLDGIEEVFSIMFTDRALLCLMDEEATQTNVYDETPEKFYQDPIALVAKITTTFEQGELPIEEVQIDALFTVPTKQLITNLIPHETEEDLETLKKGKFVYDGTEYLIAKVKPKTLVADKWQMYDFSCYVDKKTSLKGE